jgi:hypothetical protein
VSETQGFAHDYQLKLKKLTDVLELQLVETTDCNKCGTVNSKKYFASRKYNDSIKVVTCFTCNEIIEK